MRNAAVIQAAGKGSRFLSDRYKLLAPVAGVPMILRTVEPVLQAGFDEIVIVVGYLAAEMREVLAGLPVKIIENTDWEKGQSTSLSAGVRVIQTSSDCACLLLGDQPFLKSETLRALIVESESHPGDIVVPFYQGRRGNPIVVPSEYYELLLTLTEGDEGGRKLLKTAGYRELSVEDPGVLRDIDTIGELKRYE